MDLADRGHAGMIDRYRLGAELDGGEVVDSADGLIYAARGDFPVMMNGAVPATGGDPVRLVAAAREFFADRRRAFGLFTRSPAEHEAAAGAGMHAVIEHYPAMVLRERVREPGSAGVHIRPVTDVAGGLEYLRVADSAFTALGVPAGVLAGLRPEAFFGRDDTASFVATLDGEPVACASVVLARGIAGIQWVGVLQAARGRGLARAVTAAAANAGFDRGADCAWLEASHMGEPVYARMGFEEVFPYRIWIAAPPGA